MTSFELPGLLAVTRTLLFILPLSRFKVLLFPSVKVSEIVSADRATPQVFWTVIVYLTKSPFPLTPSPLSIIVADFNTLIEGTIGDKVTSV